MSSSTSVPALLLHGRLHSPCPASKAQHFLAPTSNPSRFPGSASVSVSTRQSPATAASPRRRRFRRGAGQPRAGAEGARFLADARESRAGIEWLRETLHKWLDDEYCPEPANVDISRTAARSYGESLAAGRSDLGEILLKMAGDLETLSYRESFHGAFSAANAAVRLITQRMETTSEEDDGL